MKEATLELTFLGTRGEIEPRTSRHRRHSALLIRHEESRLMVDCGADWLGRLNRIAPDAIVLTHAHPDHAAGLARGAPCPVYASARTLQALRRFPLRERHVIPMGRAFSIRGVRFTAFPVRHSIRAPAVGYRVSAGGRSFFYVPDVAALPEPEAALRGIDAYIGDGATFRRSMVRRKGGTWIGHASIEVQLEWCRRARIRLAVFTHCGSPIVRGNARRLNASLRQLGCKHGVDARCACDGDRLVLPPRA